jgi:hypothetical protein
MVAPFPFFPIAASFTPITDTPQQLPENFELYFVPPAKPESGLGPHLLNDSWARVTFNQNLSHTE